MKNLRIKRVETLELSILESISVNLEWQKSRKDNKVYLKYIAQKEKILLSSFKLIGLTEANSFEDTNLDSDRTYFYHIRLWTKPQTKNHLMLLF